MLKTKFKTNYFDDDNEANPMDGVSNMSDCMLVLAVGIMLAVVINWKVDIKSIYSTKDLTVSIDENDLQEVTDENLHQSSSNVSYEDLESKYKKSGTVYTDVYSGKTYVVIED